MLNLTDWGMYEHHDVLVQPFPNGKAMQVKLEPDKIGVRSRLVPISDARNTTSDKPKWLSAYGHIMSEWMRDNSPVWQWLKLKGIDEAGVMRRLVTGQAKREYQLTCPVCDSTVVIQQQEVASTVSMGGHGTVGSKDSAMCPKCGKQFTQP